MSDISSSADTIDIRDVIERVEELQELRDDYQSMVDEADEARANVLFHHSDATDITEALARDFPECIEARELIAALDRYSPLDADETEELRAMEELLADLKGYGGDHQWEGSWYPVTLVADSYFKEYAQEMAEEMGDCPADRWPHRHIDWDAAADALKEDYSSVDYDGNKFWYR